MNKELYASLRSKISFILCLLTLMFSFIQTVYSQDVEENEPVQEESDDISSDAAVVKTPVYGSNGIYIVKNENAWYPGNMNTGESWLENSNGVHLSGSYLNITALSGKFGLYQFSVPAGHQDSFQGVFKLNGDKSEEIMESGKFPLFSCIDAPNVCVFFPIGYANEYYDIDGNKIEDLGIYLKQYGISVERDSWAEKAITNSLDKKYLPCELAFNYRENITRREYCRLAVSAAKHMEIYGIYTDGKFISDLALKQSYVSPYSDVDDYYVSAAAELGIVSGMGNGKFEPDRPITRQEAAVLLINLSKLINKHKPADNVPKFADDAAIGEWAKSSVYEICSIRSHNGDGIMVGVGSNKFAPTSAYTREQAIVTVYRLLDDYDE